MPMTFKFIDRDKMTPRKFVLEIKMNIIYKIVELLNDLIEYLLKEEV